jgi:AcrR family transcriptional regulator
VPVLSQGTPDPPPRRQRVPALAPDDRRAALIEATIPLLREHGLNVSTRQIAGAAGVAEGTIFGVFPDKASLINAAVASAFDPTPMVRQLRAIDPSLDLRARMVAAAELLREHLATFGVLLHVIRHGDPGGRAVARVDLMAARYLVLYELSALIEPDAARLRRSPSTVARLLMSMLIVPRDGFDDLAALDPHEIVSLLLDGLLTRDVSHADDVANTKPNLESSC